MQAARHIIFYRLRNWAESRWFFYVLVLLFTVSCAWVALTSLYPMAFDEDFHLGLIKIYAAHILPFGIADSPEMATFGAATHDPSYLFQYLMSFPYRIFTWFGFSQTVIVILLRFIDIGLMVAALFWFRKTLLALNLSSFSTNIVLALFMLIPIVPLVAAQINYDNLLLLETAIGTYLAVRIAAQIRERRTISPLLVISFAIICLAGSATKYAFLPVVLAMVVYVLATLVWYRRKTSWRVVRTLLRDFTRLTSWKIAVLVIGLIVALLANAKYIENALIFHRFIPDCAQVFTPEDCQSYGPWARNEMLKQSLDSSFSPKSFPAYFVEDWLVGMTYRLLFSVAGPSNDFATRDPLPVVLVIYIAVAALGTLAFLRYGWQVLRRNPAWWIAIGFIGLYIVPLSFKLYGSYKITGDAVAVNGRYLLPVLPIIGGLLLLSIQQIHFKNWRITRQISTLIAAGVFALLVLEGGGVGTYIVRGETPWFYDGFGQNSHNVAKAALDTFTIR